MKTRARMLLIAIGSTALVGVGGPASAAPTCSTEMGIANHGQHIVGDYVSGLGHDAMGWPPAGQVGQATGGNGAAAPGAAGAHGHMLVGIAPGASFCTGSNSPGFHFP